MRLQSLTYVTALAFVLAGCDGGADDTGATGDTDAVTYTLTFDGGDTYGGAHGDQDFGMAVVECDSGSQPCTGTTVASDAGTVPATGDWTVTFDGALEDGLDYELHLWIDSNFGGGTAGTCDADTSVDHQWAFVAGTATDDVTVQEDHDPSGAAYVVVCDSFST